MPRKVCLGLAAAALFAACRGSEEAVVARIGRAVITEEDFQHKLSGIDPSYQNYVMTPYGRKQFLDVLVRERLMLQASRADGVEASPEFKDRMRAIRQEEEQRLAEARDYLLTRLWLDRLKERGMLKVSGNDVEEYLRKHPVEVRARHILLPTAEEAEAMLNRIRQGASFAALAKTSSLDADSAENGGEMPPALVGEIIPELEVVFKMRTGEIGGPLRSRFGYHLLIKESESRPVLEKVQDRIRNVLEKRKLDAYLKTLQSSFPVEVVDAQFK